MNLAPNPAIRLTIGWLSFVLCRGSAPAASLLLDTQFRTSLFAEPYPANRTLLQQDGKFLVFSSTDTLTDVRTGAITRYLSTGTLDTSFSFSRDYKFVHAAAVAPNGQLIIATIQYSYGTGFGTEKVLRLNSDGTIDSAFTISMVQPYPYTTVRSIIVESGGTILVVGSFTDFGGSGRQKIVRLLADGNIDSTFNPPQFSGGFYGIYPAPILNDGKILVAGDFDQVNGSDIPGITRLNSDGSLDVDFQASGFTRYGGASTPIRGLGITSDGKILIAGRFHLDGWPSSWRAPIIRIQPNGVVDTSYFVQQFGSSAIGRDLVIQPDDQSIVAISDSVYRIDPTGVVDPTFFPPSFVALNYSPSGTVGFSTTLSLQSDLRVIVAGTFTDVNASGNTDDSHFGVVRLNSDGSIDPAFVMDHRTGFEDSPTSFARLSDGSVLTAFRTSHQRHDPAMSFNLGRLLPNGMVDPSFTLSSSDPGGIPRPDSSPKTSFG